jgi:hypothetical protein
MNLSVMKTYPLMVTAFGKLQQSGMDEIILERVLFEYIRAC